MSQSKTPLPRPAKLFPFGGNPQDKPFGANPQGKPFGGDPQGKPQERRHFLRFRVPLPLTVSAYSNGRAVVLERAPALENISAGGLAFSLGAGSALPEAAELEISFPLVESAFRPTRVYARCRARLVRRDAPDRVAVRFEEVEFVREEGPSGLPVPITG